MPRGDSAYQLVQPTAEVLADGVVNGWGAVCDVQDLVVANASIIPYHVDDNTSASAYFIGYSIAKHLLGQ